VQDNKSLVGRDKLHTKDIRGNINMDEDNIPMLEDEVVNKLSRWLTKKGWSVDNLCLGHAHGNDITAVKDTEKLFVEAKGGRGNPKSPVTTREKFNCSQIKTHFGKAIVKMFEERHKNPGPGVIVAIAQPDDKYIIKCLSGAIPGVINAGIKLFWVSDNGDVREQ